jgi:tRNA(Ile)-lysidine synthase
MELLDQVRTTIARHALAPAGTRVMVALSGGPDSVALAYLLRSLAAAGELELVGLAHLNHQLRDAADADARFCQDLARDLGLPLALERADIAASARRERRSLEDVAHDRRYEFLTRAMVELRADCVALGHSRDDQAETFLLRLTRGAGARGLAGMYPRRDRFIRPLLDCRRAELRRYLAAQGVESVHDASNDDVAIPRNRVRAELLPLLQSRFNPRIVDVLADEADIAREEWRWLQTSAAALHAAACRRDGEALRLDAAMIAGAPLAIARLAVRQAMEEVSGGRPVSLGHVAAALEMCQSGRPAVDAPGHRLERRGSDVVLRGSPGRGVRGVARHAAPLFSYPLPVPGEVEVPEANCSVSAATGVSEWEPTRRTVAGDLLHIVQVERCPGPLAVRNRRAGDWFRPPGLNGRKKLQDFFVDRKVPRERRDAVPLVVDVRDRIVWVAGHSADAEFLVQDPAQAVIILRLRLWGGSV